MVWLVTGGNGQLGRALSFQLALRNVDFLALDSRQLDITNTSHVNHVIKSLKPDVVINCAAWTDVDGAELNRDSAFNVNEVGVKNLVLATKCYDSMFIHFSTDYVFSGKSTQPLLENSILDPLNVYGKSKAAGESHIKQLYSERSYILRTAWLYSAHGKNFVKTICSMAVNTKNEVRVVNDQFGQPTSAHDLAKQTILLVNSGADFGIYHGTNSGQTTWFECAREIFRIIGADENRVIPITSDEFPSRTKRPSYSVLGHDAWERSGIEPMREWKEAMKEDLPEIVDSILRTGD